MNAHSQFEPSAGSESGSRRVAEPGVGSSPRRREGAVVNEEE